MWNNIQELWDNYERCNIHVLEIPEKEGREKGTEEIFGGIMPKHFLKLMTDTKPQIQEVRRTPSKMNIKKKFTTRYKIFKLQKT